MRIVIFFQLILYLIISPLMVMFTTGFDGHRFDLSISMVIFFIIGAFFHPDLLKNQNNFQMESLSVKNYFKYFVIIISIIYVYIIVSNNLLNRRQGSEVMAQIHANLPIIDLIFMRGYEIVYYPVLIVLVLFGRDKKILNYCMFGALFIGFIFSGIAVSRTKFIIPVILYIVFRDHIKIYELNFSKVLTHIGMLGVFFGLIYVTQSRLTDFNDAQDYLMQDIFKRLDGIEFISSLDKVKFLPWSGTFDVKMLNVFNASLPFSVEANSLKELGLTTTKSYILQEIIGLNQIDINNSIITDPYYFGGWLGLVFAGYLYGLFVAKFQISLNNGDIWSGRVRSAFMLAFLMNGMRVENDFISIIFLSLRDFFIIYLVFWGLRFKCED